MKQVLLGLALVSMLVLASAAFAQDPAGPPPQHSTANAALVINQYCTVSITNPSIGTQTVTLSSGPAPYTFTFGESAAANFPCVVSIAQTGVPSDDTYSLTDSLSGTYPYLATTSGTATLSGTTTWADVAGTYPITVTLTVAHQ